MPTRAATNAPRAPGSHARAGVLLAALFLAGYFAVAATIGFHGPAAAWVDYGEPPVGPPVQQPICFWSNLAFVIAGVALLRGLDGADGKGSNPMRGPSPYARALGLLTVWMGPASMLEHGTLTTTWGWFDAASIHWFALFVSGYLLLRAVPGAAESPRGRAMFWGGEAAAAAVLGVWTWHMEQVRMAASLVLLTAVGAAMLAALVLGPRVGLRFAAGAWRWFAGVALAFAVGFACLVAGAAGGPAAPWGHGAWHVCCAVAMVCVGRLLAAEAPRTAG